MNDDTVRQQVAERWNQVAPGWRRLRDHIAENTQPVTDQLVDMLRVEPGERVLDLACGTGNPTFTLAERVGPRGYVLGLDLSSEMVEVARAQAAETGLTVVEFRQTTSENSLDVERESFDAATCRFGLMFMPDPVGALSAIRHALKPEGRVGVATWGPAENNPFAHLKLEIVGRHVDRLEGPPDAPSWDLVSSIDGLEGVLLEAGFEDLETAAVEVAVARGTDPADLWDHECEISMTLLSMLAPLSPATRETIRQDAIRTIGALKGGGPVEFTAEALVSVGINPGD